MSAAVLDRPTAAGCRVPLPPEGPRTLDALVRGAWAGLARHGSVACPVCGGSMHPRYGASGAAPVGGRCVECGSTLG